MTRILARPGSYAQRHWHLRWLGVFLPPPPPGCFMFPRRNKARERQGASLADDGGKERQDEFTPARTYLSTS
jgi:hypothetical protein